jgi:hypothetical protein
MVTKNKNGSTDFSKTTYTELNANTFSGFTDFIAGGQRKSWQSQWTQFLTFTKYGPALLTFYSLLVT